MEVNVSASLCQGNVKREEKLIKKKKKKKMQVVFQFGSNCYSIFHFVTALALCLF